MKSLEMDGLFTSLNPSQINDNIFDLIGNQWMLIASGQQASYNMMTASWGCAGFLWKKPVSVIFVRPQRYTYLFLEKHAHYTLNFFDEVHRPILDFCGTHSGKDTDKMQVQGLDPMITPMGNVAFRQARLVLECRKLYYDDIKPGNFLSFEIERMYPAKDYHRMYIGEIASVWQRDQ